MDYTLKNVHINSALRMGASMGARQLFVCKNMTGNIQVEGNLDIREVITVLEAKVREEDALRLMWVPKDKNSFPKLANPISDLFKKPNLVKSAAGKAMHFFLKAGKMKLGRDTFPGWHYQIQKAYLVYSSDIVKGLPDVFTLNQIVEWSDLLGANISNGRLSALKAESGVSSWLGLCKVLIEFSFLVTGHDPAVWVESGSSPGQPALASSHPVVQPREATAAIPLADKVSSPAGQR